ILHVTADRAGSDRSKPFNMIQKPKIFLNLDMAHVVPITDVRGGDFIKQLRDFALRWNFLIPPTPLNPKPNIFLSRAFDNRLEALPDARKMRRRGAFARSHCVDF